MKGAVKRLSGKIGIYYPLNYLRQSLLIMRWLRQGCPSPAPHAIKMNIVRAYLRKYDLKYFIETGTFYGDTLGYIAREGVECTSIELSRKLFTKGRERFTGVDNVRLIQ